MFTGIVETVGSVARVETRRGSTRLEIASTLPVAEIRRGDSVAVDGVCLTVVSTAGDRFAADVVEETRSRTTLRRALPGAKVNLERAVVVGGRLGGHLVQGHVDGVARVLRVARRGDDWRLRVALHATWSRFVAEKGSIAVQGVSLTVSVRGASFFEVALVPETRARTTMGGLAEGDEVNVEVDLVARYLGSLTGSRAPRRPRPAGGE